MRLVALIAVVVYCGVSLVMAIRLIALHRRTHELPELMIGLAFLMGGMLGYTLNVAAGFLLAASRPEAAQLAYALGQIGMAVGAYFLLLAWHNIFARSRRSAGWLTFAWGLVLVGAVIAVIRTTGPVAAQRLMSGYYWVQLVAQGACYGITAVASLRYGAMLDRRRALGMADPVVANRLWLWGMSNTAITTSYAYSLAAGVLLSHGLPNVYNPVVVSALGLTSAVCITLGFLPPRAYLARIRARATRTAS